MLSPSPAQPKQVVVRHDLALAQRLRLVLAARDSLAERARQLPVAVREQLVSAARPFALPVAARWKQPRSAALPLSPLALRRKTSTVAPQSGLAWMIWKLLPAQLAPRQAAQPGSVSETRPERETRQPARSEAVCSECPRAGRPEARSTSADPARALVSRAPASKRAATAPVPARAASFRLRVRCRLAWPPRRPLRSRCSPSPCDRRSGRKYTFCPAGTFLPCRIWVRPPGH